jgi:hypothetical protein
LREELVDAARERCMPAPAMAEAGRNACGQRETSGREILLFLITVWLALSTTPDEGLYEKKI